MIKLKYLSFSLIALASFFIFAPAGFAQDILDPACGEAPNSPVCSQTGTTTNPVVTTIRDAANIIALVAGFTAVIMIILGGLAYVTSSGNQESVAKAQRRIVYSAVGLAIIGLAWTITRLITDRVLQ